MDADALVLCGALFFIAALYASVGHGGASGYLALLSLSSFASMNSSWLKQHAWVLNLVVAGLAFYHFQKAGYHRPKLSFIFIVASLPAAFFGGTLDVDGNVYDALLSFALLFAAYRLVRTKKTTKETEETPLPGLQTTVPIGASIGVLSGMIGVGGGIFLSPILVLKRWASPKAAAATAALFIWVNSAAGLLGAQLSGQLELSFSPLASFALAVGCGGFVGSKFGAEKAPQATVRWLLIGVLLLATAKRASDVVL
jgi:uncharacterized protein|tara:strand:+ start:2002 stop:2766 length:765 start_codon:yes stop_codon:yes gene_type:complete